MPPETLAQLYTRALGLTPRAARFAEKLLRRSLTIPFEVRHAMVVALMEKLAVSKGPTAMEWSALEQGMRSKDARTHADVTQAHLFVDACASFAAKRQSDKDSG
jgi:hypothetical protein